MLRKPLKLAEKRRVSGKSFAKVLPKFCQKPLRGGLVHSFLSIFSAFSQVLALLAKVLAKLVALLPEPKPHETRGFESFLANWQNFPYIVSKKRKKNIYIKSFFGHVTTARTCRCGEAGLLKIVFNNSQKLQLL